MAAKAPMAIKADDVHRVLSTAVDPTFYRMVYPELAGADPFKHYLLIGWREGRDPAPWFSTRAYLAANDDVRAAGLEPLSHYLSRGVREGREPAPSEHADAYYARTGGWLEGWSFEATAAAEWALAAEGEATPAQDRAAIAAEFDGGYYLEANPDIRQGGVDPLHHFLLAGWREGRNPNRTFSVHEYLDANPDVAETGANPFVHFVRRGRAEGRPARHDLGFRYDVIARQVPPVRRLEAAMEAARAVATGKAAALRKGLAESRTGLAKVHVTFSHDDYTANLGGVQLCVLREDARFAERGVDHLHLYPATPWPFVREAREPGPLGVLLNGRRLGVYSPRIIREALAAAPAPAAGRSFAIHSLLGHSVADTTAILESLGLRAGFFWVHDFASVCAGVHLLRNDVEDCAAPPPTSMACSVCGYGPLRARHLAAHRRLFEQLDLTVVAPSETTLDFWRASTGLSARAAAVVPHAALVDAGPAPARGGPLTVAFLGMPTASKGWPVFRDVATAFADDPRYRFLHLGGQADTRAPAEFHAVTATAHRPDAMRHAAARLGVDVAVVWPLCRETFSFTAYEAAAGGAAVLTGPDSGNVAAFVAETGLGRVLDNETALGSVFASGEVLALGRGRRGARLHDLVYSGMTAELVAA